MQLRQRHVEVLGQARDSPLNAALCDSASELGCNAAKKGFHTGRSLDRVLRAVMEQYVDIPGNDVAVFADEDNSTKPREAGFAVELSAVPANTRRT